MTTASRSLRFHLGTALTAGILAMALGGGCGDDRSLLGESDTSGALTGTIQNYVLDFDNGTTGREHFLEVGASSDAIRLHFDVEPTVASGDRLRVWGTSEGDGLRVTRYEILPAPQEDLATVRSALTTVTPKTNKNAFVLVDVGGGVNVTAAMATSSVFTPGNNFANMYNVLSFGGMIYSGDVLGPFPYTMTTCDYSGLKTAVKAMITTGTYDHYMWYLGSKVSACAWSGIGSEGNATKPQSDSWYNASTGCTVLVQEVGHNNGWMHSSTLTCAGASFVDDPTGGGCTTSEYGNRYTPMGSGCGHFDAMDKWYGGYFGGCNAVKVTSSGTFNLMPIENPCNGIQGIQVPMPKTTRTFKAEQDSSATPIKNYYLEFRVPGGVDTAIKTPAVFVNVSNDIAPSTKTSYHSFLLDMNPSTTTFDGMTVGQTFMDPAGGVSFTLVSADTTHASVQITIDSGTGGPTCMDGTILTAPGPTDCGTVPTSGAGGTTGTAGTTGTTGAGGRGGASGAGRGGSGGTSAGTAGTTGAGGRGGGSGGTSAGAAGTNGAAGTSGAAGGPGVGGGPGIGGSLGRGGSAAPTAGSSGIGTGGATAVTGAAGQTGAPGQTLSPVTGGCACSTAPDLSEAAGRAWFTLTGVGLIVALRRRRKH